jgi:rhodanese-related sulfurtransferase
MYQSISMPEFEQEWKRKNLQIVDVRELDEWENGHVEGAIHMPLSDFPNSIDKLDKDKEYFIMCLTGARSAMVCQHLSQDGYKVTNIMGGISTWRGDIV